MSPVEAYILGCPEQHRERLYALRDIILAAVPGLTEKISWGMPTFAMKKNVLHFALNKAHTGIYPGPAAIAHFEDRLRGFETSKGTIRLPHSEPLPKELLSDLARWCAENRGP